MLKISFLQILPGNSLEENLKKGIDSCKIAKEKGADIAIFPEMWSNGYDIIDTPFNKWSSGAIEVNSPFILAFKHLAAQLNMAIAITFLEKFEGGPRNTVVLFDRFGKQCFSYAKVHTCDFGAEKNLTLGDEFFVSTLNTVKGNIQVGAMICYDREFPESARILMLKGAELIIVPNACPMEINRLAQLRARAYENMTAIATCNYPLLTGDCNGHSTLYDGVAYLPNGKSRDMCMLECGEQAGVFVAELNTDQLRAYREQEVHGNAYRHPQKYQLITQERITYPFVRKYYRR